MTWDTTELDALSDEMVEAALRVDDAAMRVLRKGAVNIKKSWRENAKASAGSHAGAYPYSITFDEEKSTLGVVIGPDKARRQGALGNLIEFGSVNNPPHDDGGRALREEAPKTEQWLARAVGDILP